MKTEWLKVKNLKVGSQIAVCDRPAADVDFALSAEDDVPSGQNSTSDNIGTGTLVWDEIVSIESVGREQVYDIEVEGTHNFVAGHLLNKNTKQALSLEEEQLYLGDRRLPRGMEQRGIL